MKVLINESQFLKILKENKENEIEEVFSNSKNFTKKVISDVKTQFNLDFNFLTTWGSIIGGFVGPISEYMEGKYPNLSEQDITLISFGLILTFFSSNTEKLNKVLQIIKDKKIITFFDIALMKAYDLKEAFFSFLESLNITFSKVSSMVAYTFLVPLVPLISDIVKLDLTEDQINLLATGISHHATTIISSKILYRLVKKMIERFRSKI